MPDSVFHFKQFTIHQDKCAMKVGTDAVLLGSWVQPGDSARILDIGTGTGILALMLAQKSPANIVGVEIDHDSSIQAQENVDLSPWNDRIRIQTQSIQSFALEATEKFDLIVSNPPYFTEDPKPSNQARLKARHSGPQLSFTELLDAVTELLATSGIFCVILPTREGSQFKELAMENGLFCNSLVRIRTKKNKEEKRMMMEFSAQKKDYSEKKLVLIEEDGRYSNEYLELTKDYYLGLKEYRNITF